MKKFRFFLAAFLIGSTLLWSTPEPANAQVLKRLRDSISNLWNRKSSTRQSARKSRAKASSINNQAQAARFRLQKAQQLLVRANAVYQEYALQAEQTEARILRTRARIKVVNNRFKRHQQLFGARLASVQRNGQLSYLNMLLGSRTLSDLSRRMYLYQAIAARDSDLQEIIKDDRHELQTTQLLLASQWKQRNRLLQASNRERARVIFAEREQARTLKAIKTQVYAQLAQADARENSAQMLDREIGALESERSQIYAAEREERRREYSSYEPRRRNRSYRRRYRRTRYARRVSRTRYVPSRGGELRPMKVKDMAYEDVLVPNSNSGELGESFESEGSSGNADSSPVPDGYGGIEPAKILR